MKKLLFITAIPPGKNGGGELVTLKTIESLSKTFDIDLVYFTYPNHENLADPYVKTVQKYNPAYTNCLKKIVYFPLFTRRYSKTIKNEICRIANNYDVLFFDYSQTAIYSLYVKHSNKIIRCHDIILQKYSRKNFFILPWVYMTERKILKSASKVFCLVEKDALLLKKFYGIEASYTSDVLNLSKQEVKCKYEINESFVFFGYWARKENSEGLVWFLKNVFPLLTEEARKSLKIMGGGLPESVYSKYIKPNNIEYLGFVDNCYEELWRAKAVIVPLFQGAGVKIKVLDAFSCGTPVIGTKIAFEGISSIQGLTFQCDNKTDFADIINNFHSVSFEEKIINKNKFEQLANGNKLEDLIGE